MLDCFNYTNKTLIEILKSVQKSLYEEPALEDKYSSLKEYTGTVNEKKHKTV